VQRFRGGLVFKAHRHLYHSTLGLRVIKKRRRRIPFWEHHGPLSSGEGTMRMVLKTCVLNTAQDKARIWL